MSAADDPGLIDLLGLLPGVDVVGALGCVRNEHDATLAGEALDERWANVGATLAGFGEALHEVERDGDLVTTVSPAGARLLLALHEKAAFFPQARPTAWAPAPKAFIDYAGGETWMVEGLRRRERERAEYTRKLDDLSEWREADFGFRVLNAVFPRHHAKGDGMLVIDGISVTRLVTAGLVPNANLYSWVGSDGRPRACHHSRLEIGQAALDLVTHVLDTRRERASKSVGPA